MKSFIVVILALCSAPTWASVSMTTSTIPMVITVTTKTTVTASVPMVTMQSIPTTRVAAKLKYEPIFILQEILKYKHLEYKPELALPDLFLASQTSVEIFQEDIFPQWGFKPDVITNSYVAHSNHIYLSDDQNYYEETKRCMDDSLAHELTHYIQYKYHGWDLSDESLEWDAVDTQTWFRENYCQDLSPH